MATYQELNEFYKSLYNKDFPPSTLSKWVKEKRIQVTQSLSNKSKYDYNFEDFQTIVTSEKYANKVKAAKENPKNYIGTLSGSLLITGIVPKNEYQQKNYQGTLMYCKCLKCNRPDLIQVRFSYLTPNGNYHQNTCGCGRKERVFLASTRPDLDEEFLMQFDDFDKFLMIHKTLVRTTDKYYSTCPVNEYREAILKFYNDIQFNTIYQFWQQNKNKNETYYDWAKPSLDHIIPRSRGGTNDLKNLQILTVFENLAKRDMTAEEWKQFKQDTHTISDYFIESLLTNEVI